MERKFSLPDFGYEVVLGKFANQADGSAWLQCGGTIVLATVCSAPSTEFPGFLPLTVDYREQFSAAGKIPGGYFKREGKFSDHEVLVSRLMDRSIRPLFPENYFDKIQVMTTVYSVDKENVPEMLALLATSIALSTSKIPFMGPISAAEVARIDGAWVVNPKYDQIQKSDVRIIVSGTEEGICMVEGSVNQLSETEMIDAFFIAHEAIKKQVAWQKEIQKQLNVEKAPIVDQFDWKIWTDRVYAILTDERVAKMFNADKVERSAVRAELKALFLGDHAEEITQLGINPVFLEYIFDKNLRNRITELCFTLHKRVDGRNFDQVRQITGEVGLLPFAHGSALFTRGRTQALVSVTLGGGQDKAKTDQLMGNTIESSFMLHYNFPSFSVGEVRPQRGPGRREIGHGYLAMSALERMLPDQEKFPYTIRIVADMLESDGSTSMATTCGSTLALMDAGVPLKHMVSGWYRR
jgi:polyribonucleotide nucleotidyltransferase